MGYIGICICQNIKYTLEKHITITNYTATRQWASVKKKKALVTKDPLLRSNAEGLAVSNKCSIVPGTLHPSYTPLLNMLIPSNNKALTKAGSFCHRGGFIKLIREIHKYTSEVVH